MWWNSYVWLLFLIDRKSLLVVFVCIFFLVGHIYCLSHFVLEDSYLWVSFCGGVPTLFPFFATVIPLHGPKFTFVTILYWNSLKFNKQRLLFGWNPWSLHRISGKHDGRPLSTGSHGSCAGRSDPNVGHRNASRQKGLSRPFCRFTPKRRLVLVPPFGSSLNYFVGAKLPGMGGGIPGGKEGDLGEPQMGECNMQ